MIKEVAGDLEVRAQTSGVTIALVIEAPTVSADPDLLRRVLENLVEGTDARTGTLDPEGGRLPAGADLYFVLMRQLAQNIRGCLAAPA